MSEGRVGVVLAGGAGRRLGGAKATAELGGRPLIDWPLAALREALGPDAELAVVAKATTALPALTGVAVWIEPPAPSHPLVGLVRALEGAAGRPVLVCPVDVPFVTAATLARLAEIPGGLAGDGGRVHPLLGRWEPGALPALRDALAVGEPLPAMRALAADLGAPALEVDDGQLVNVNTPEDLAAARARARDASNSA